MSNTSQDVSLHFVSGSIDRFEDDKAVLKLADGQELIWPRAHLPGSAKEGTAVKLKLLTDIGEVVEREELAKSILNEILKNSK